MANNGRFQIFFKISVRFITTQKEICDKSQDDENMAKTVKKAAKTRRSRKPAAEKAAAPAAEAPAQEAPAAEAPAAE